uniref:Uncharacterized protein n=1 Tax=Chlamydomonas leiostraca TaxID=1034604 RepID=A0A7S0WTF2_9CHLO
MGRAGGGLNIVPSPRRLRGGPLGTGAARASQIVAGAFTSGLVGACGRVWTWGHGGTWALGHGEQLHEFAPRQLLALSDYKITSLALGQSHAMAAPHDGRKVFVWGTDSFGTLGYGDGNWQQLPFAVPQELKTLAPEIRTKSVSVGWQHSALVDQGGALYTWGWSGAANSDRSWLDGGGGQLGQGDDRDRWEPTPVSRLHTSEQRFYDLRMSYVKPWRVVQVSAGRTHTAAVIDVELDMRDLA